MKRRNSRKDIDKDKMFSKLMPTFPLKNDDDYVEGHKFDDGRFQNSNSPKRPYAHLSQSKLSALTNNPHNIDDDDIPYSQTNMMNSPNQMQRSEPMPASPKPEIEELQSQVLYQHLQKAAKQGYIDPQTQAFLNAARNAAQMQENQDPGPSITAFMPEVIKSSSLNESNPAPAPAPTQDPVPAPAPAPVVPTEPEPVKDDSIQLVNIIEYVVESKLESSMNAFKCCSCQKCKQAATLKILNSILPEYTYTRPSEAKNNIDESKYKNLNQPIIRSILDVKANPPH